MDVNSVKENKQAKDTVYFKKMKFGHKNKDRNSNNTIPK